MARQVINLGNSVNDGTGDVLRVGAQKINSNFAEIYTLLGESNGSIQVVSSIVTGPGLTASNPSGQIRLTPVVASTESLGIVKVGQGISISNDGTISVTPYSLPRASTNILGGIKVGNNLSIDNEGVLSADTQTYSLPTASPTTLGGVKIGSGLEIQNGVINVIATDVASALISGPVTVSLDDTGPDGELLSSGSLSILSKGTGKRVSLKVQTDEENSNPVNYVDVSNNGFEVRSVNSQGEITSNWVFNTNNEITSNEIKLVSDTGVTVEASNGLHAWEFSSTGTLSIPFVLQFNGNTEILSENIEDLEEDILEKQLEISGIQSQISDKQGELSYWQSIASQGPSNPLYGQALTQISVLSGQLGALQNQLSIAQGELAVLQNSLANLQSLLTHPYTELRYVAEDGVLDIDYGALRFPDGSIQRTAYLGDAIEDIEIRRLVNDTALVTLESNGTLLIPGKISSNSLVEIQSAVDTSIVAGTDLKLYSNGLFALRNYSTENSIAIITNFNDPSQKAWLFNNNGTTTLPTATVPTSAKGSEGDVQGMFAIDAQYIYYCTADYTDGEADIWNRTLQTAW
jgi:hypothetical protein